MPLTELEQQLCRSLQRRADGMLRDLARHVAIPTGGNFKSGLDEYREVVLARLRAIGASTELVPGDPRPQWLMLPGSKAAQTHTPPTAIARGPASPGQRRVLIAGHLDTVHDPLGSFQRLSIARDHRIAVGPGAVDMKGGIVIAIAALEALAECGVETSWTFLLNSDEETGSFHSERCLRSEARAHEIGLALEPALPDGSLVTQRMGSGQFKIEVSGRAAHVGRDFACGVSAVTRLGEILIRLANLSRPEEGVIVNVGPLQGGAVTNVVPDTAACWGNVRFRDAATAQALAAEFDALATAHDSLPQVVVHRAFNRPAKPLVPAVQQLAQMIQETATDCDQTMPFAATGGVCDGNILQEEGLPTLDTLGVRGGNLHRSDEFIEIASLAERACLFAVLLTRLARVGRRH